MTFRIKLLLAMMLVVSAVIAASLYLTEKQPGPFFSTKGERGTGLGLAMVFGIIQRHHGAIDIKSAPGKGTSFLISLPVADEAMLAAAAVPGEAAAIHSGFDVLVVEDEPPIREVLAAYLSSDGHSVTTAATAREGLERFRSGHFDLVLTDKAMPGMSGDQMAGLIKQLTPDVPIILLTGFGALMEAAGEMPAGIDSLLSKPVTMNALREAIGKVMPHAA